MRQKNDLAHKKNGQLQGLGLEILKKFDVDLEKIKDEVDIVRFEMIDYEEKVKYSVFGEKKSICYESDFVIYNIHFKAKLLTFEYETKSELLKLDIDCKTSHINTEIRYCCNLLQRRRNLNLMFLTLISFTRYLEARRLIINLILKKHKSVKIEDNKDGGKIIVYSDAKRNIKVGVFWSLECNSDYEVSDKVEVYYKSAELPNVEDIKNQLSYLTEPHLEFKEKYHLWKKILESLSFDPSIIIVDNDNRENCINKFAEKPIGVTSTNSEGISVIRHPNLIPKREVKIEESEEEFDDSFNELSIVLSNEPQNNISSTTTGENLKNNHSQNEQVICLDSPRLSESIDHSNSRTSINKAVKNDIIELPSDTEDNDLNTTKSNIEVDIVPSKKLKLTHDDDDLEFTGITYLIPD